MNLALVAKHITPRFIIDIGARCGDWSREARAMWPEARFYLIEANEECLNSLIDSGFRNRIGLLSSKDDEIIPFYTLTECPMATGASVYRENTEFFSDNSTSVRFLRSITLDRMMEDETLELPILMKLDAQGSEVDILHGAKVVCKSVRAIVIEIPEQEYNLHSPKKLDYESILFQMGFKPVCELGDIVHPITREVIQKDWLYMK